MANTLVYIYVLSWPFMNEIVFVNLGVGIPDITYQSTILPLLAIAIIIREKNNYYGTFLPWLIIYIAFSLCAMFLHDLTRITFVLHSILTSYVFPFLIYFILVNQMKYMRMNILVTCIVMGGVIIAGIGITEFIAGKNIIGVSDYTEARGTRVTKLYRTNGPFYDSIGYASTLLPYLTLLYYFLHRRMISSKSYAAASAVVAFGSFVNFSRAAVLAMGMMLMTLWYRVIRKNILIVSILSVLFLAIISIYSDSILGLLYSEKYSERLGAGTIVTRWQLYLSVLNVFKDNFLIGIGYDNYFYRFGGATHNSYLQVMVETGIVGIVLFLIFIYKLTITELIKNRNNDVMYRALLSLTILVIFMPNTINLLHSQNFMTALMIVMGTIKGYQLNEKKHTGS